jgi:hypothetical protein
VWKKSDENVRYLIKKKKRRKKNVISCLISGRNFSPKNAPKSHSTLTST